MRRIAAALMAGTAIVSPGIVSREPRVLLPIVRYVGKRPSLRQRKREERRKIQQENRRNKILSRSRPSHKDLMFRESVEGLTNWQRCQWAKAGYPGLREKDSKILKPFSKAQRT